MSGDSPEPSLKLSWLKNSVLFPFLSLFLLFLPAFTAIISANRFADVLYDPVANFFSPVLEATTQLPALPAALLGGDYGLVAMFPFLILYALPTIIVFSIILAVYRTTGLLQLLSSVLTPWLRPFGLEAKDLIRVVMGFGCNVPAIVSTQACSCCTRATCISAISFGAACSYQLPATLAVFAAANLPKMGVLYLILLSLTTLIYLYFTQPKNKIPRTVPPSRLQKLRLPSWSAIQTELKDNLKDFIGKSLLIFVIICFVAAFLDWLGFLEKLTALLAPVMSLFNLPGEAATAVILGSVRKDGIAIGLLDSSSGILKVALETPTQVLTSVYLAGVLLPCIVTVFTIIHEMRWKFALKLCLRQMTWASGFAFIIAWGGTFLF